MSVNRRCFKCVVYPISVNKVHSFKLQINKNN